MAENTQQAAPKAKSKKKLIIIGAVALLLVAGGGAGVMFMGKGKPADGGEAALSEGEEIAADAHGAPDAHGKADAHGGGHGAEAKKDDGHGGGHGGGHGDSHGGGHGAGSEGGAAPPPAEPTTNYAFDNPFTVNLLDAGGRWFLTLMLEVETTSPEVVERIQKNLAPLRDSVIMLLSSKTTTELRKTEGKMKLKEEIRIRMDTILGGAAVKAIYFTDFNVVLN